MGVIGLWVASAVAAQVAPPSAGISPEMEATAADNSTGLAHERSQLRSRLLAMHIELLAPTDGVAAVIDSQGRVLTMTHDTEIPELRLRLLEILEDRLVLEWAPATDATKRRVWWFRESTADRPQVQILDPTPDALPSVVRPMVLESGQTSKPNPRGNP